MTNYIQKFFIICLALGYVWHPLVAHAQDSCDDFSPDRIINAIQLSPEIPRQASKGVNQVFHEQQVLVPFTAGMGARIAGSSDGLQPLVVDDYIGLHVHATNQTLQLDFRNQTHTAIVEVMPRDLISEFADVTAATQVFYQAQDLMGPEFRSSQVWLILWQTCTPTPQPTAIDTPTATQTATNTSTPTSTHTLVPPTYTSTPLPTATTTPEPTATATQTLAPTPTATSTPAVAIAADLPGPTLLERFGPLGLLVLGGTVALFGLVAFNQRVPSRRLNGELDVSANGQWLTTLHLDGRKASELIFDPEAETDIPSRSNPTWRAYVRKSPLDQGVEIAEMIPGLGKDSYRYQRLSSGEPLTLGPYTFTYQSFDALVDEALHGSGAEYVPAD